MISLISSPVICLFCQTIKHKNTKRSLNGYTSKRKLQGYTSKRKLQGYTSKKKLQGYTSKKKLQGYIGTGLTIFGCRWILYRHWFQYIWSMICLAGTGSNIIILIFTTRRSMMNQKGYPSHCLTKVMALEAEHFYVLDLSRLNFTYMLCIQ